MLSIVCCLYNILQVFCTVIFRLYVAIMMKGFYVHGSSWYETQNLIKAGQPQCIYQTNGYVRKSRQRVLLRQLFLI
jgi:hypothetical protein